ncbi:pyridoxamine 5'-phosphate oxidase family protein [Marinomonas sp. CT5]|uniref:pyridoxamine 5'-phosphate oxidase family protein n=1 Tax=Marinomonas sp. CT5 TaxID=2066133 RepID=UPI002015ED99|nr:pyridoxamine 5'-phosphate oxidase family protein [Marinomonas sp. CT5]
MYLESEEQLRELYGYPKGHAKDKQLTSLERHSSNFLAHSPFVTISTYAKSGSVDCSPRGGNPGFVRVSSIFSIFWFL